MNVKTLSRQRALHLPVPSLFHDRETRRDRKRRASSFFANERSAIALPTNSAAARFACALPPPSNPNAFGLSCRCGGDRASRIVIDQLGVNMFPGQMNCQSGSLRGTCNFLPDPAVNALPRCFTNRRHAY